MMMVISLALGLGGCGSSGGDGSGGGNVPLAGVWTGVFNNDELGQSGAITAIFQGGRLMMLDDFGRVYNGDYPPALSRQFTTTIFRFSSNGVHDLTMAGAGDLISGALDIDYRVPPSPELRRIHLAARSPASDATASLASLNDIWVAGDLVIPIDGNGTITGGAGGSCQYSGTIEVISPGLNIYKLSGFPGFTAFSCGAENGSYTGFATLLENGNALLMLLSNTQRALHFRVTRQ